MKNRKPKGYWTYERCKEEALKYKNRDEFGRMSVSAYDKARRGGFLDEICDHMNPKSKPKGYWTYENCKEEALKYKTRDEFRKSSSGAYNSTWRNGWLDEVCSHMVCGNEIAHNKNRIWTYDKCQEVSIGCRTISELRENYNWAYGAIRKNGWVEDLFSHMESGYDRLSSSRTKWTYEICKVEALKYKTRADFKKNSKGAYNASAKRKWLDEVCSHMVKVGNLRHRCIYAFEFVLGGIKYVYVGLTWNIDERLSNHKKGGTVFDFCKKNGIYTESIHPLKLSEYIDISDAIIKEGIILDKYLSDGWVKINKVKTGGVGGYSRSKISTYPTH